MNFYSLLLESEQVQSGMDVLSLSTIIAAVIAAVISVTTNGITNRRLKSNFYSQTVSDARIKWIESMRRSLVEMLAFLTVNKGVSYEELSDEKKSQIELLRNDLLVHITPMSKIEEYNREYFALQKSSEKRKRSLFKSKRRADNDCVEEALPQIGTLTPTEQVEAAKAFALYSYDALLYVYLYNGYDFMRDNIQEIRDVVTIICKEEWNRIKAEAGGDKNLEKHIYKYQKSVLKQRIDISEKETKSGK